MVKNNFWSVKGYLKKRLQKKRGKKRVKKINLCKHFAQRPENRIFENNKPLINKKKFLIGINRTRLAAVGSGFIAAAARGQTTSILEKSHKVKKNLKNFQIISLT